MTFAWWLVWMLSGEPRITTSHWLSFLILAAALDLGYTGSRA